MINSYRINSASFCQSLDKAARDIEQGAAQSVFQAAETAASFAKVVPVFKSRTYKLRSSIHASHTGRFSARTSADAKYAGYVENGTRAHEILPRRKKFLRFVQNGVVYFRKRVWHPGTEPRPFMRMARDRTENVFERLVRAAVSKAL